jgi:peptide/nickel transport system permease protein
MLSDGRAHFFQAPHILLGPALFIIMTVLALNLIGEGLRDRLDPYEIIQI